mmetsp:Transcript_8137/g.25423  ORF Transcript_8137/g.25423 Transcript_8137/m.25423 type:complete len:204 (-) Transcript_8137:574-1185(-)
MRRASGDPEAIPCLIGLLATSFTLMRSRGPRRSWLHTSIAAPLSSSRVMVASRGLSAECASMACMSGVQPRESFSSTSALASKSSRVTSRLQRRAEMERTGPQPRREVRGEAPRRTSASTSAALPPMLTRNTNTASNEPMLPTSCSKSKSPPSCFAVVSDMSLSTSCDEDLFIPSLLVANSLANSCARPDSSLPAPCTMTSKF